MPARVAAIEYDPNRSARIALLHYADGEKRYILAPRRPAGRRQRRWPDRGADIKPGNAMPLSQIPLGTTVHNVELRPGRGAQLGRSAGAAIQLMAKEGDYGAAQAAVRRAAPACRLPAARPSARSATSSTRNVSLGKAGRTRWLGRRPQRPRRRDEPGRPSARRRRGRVEGQSSADRRGASRPRATSTPPQPAHRSLHRQAARIERRHSWHVRSRKARSSTLTC